MPKVNVVGWYDKRNAGDESYKIAFPILFPHLDFVFSDQPIANADAYILGGGDIVSPVMLRSMQNLKKPCHLMSVTLGSSVDPQMASVFSRAIVRDDESLANAMRLSLDVTYCPDFAFAIPSNRERGLSLIKQVFARERSDKYENVVGVVVNAHLMDDHASLQSRSAMFEHFSYQLAKTIDDTNASFLFIPFGKGMPWDDRAANSSVATKCKFWKKNAIMFEDLSAQDTIDIVSALSGLVSTRLHSSIFAIANGIPFLDIIHNHKNKSLLKSVQHEQAAIPLSGFNYQDAKNRLSSMLNNRALSKEVLAIGTRQRQLLGEVIKNVCVV